MCTFSGNVSDEQAQMGTTSPTDEATPTAPQATVIPGVDSLIGDLLDMDLGGPTMQQQMYAQPQSQTPVQSGMDLLGEGLDSLVSSKFKKFKVLYFQINGPMMDKVTNI